MTDPTTDMTSEAAKAADAPVFKDPRRHDLDALRAFAMLLGILLHAALSFVPETFWMVQDERPSGLVEQGFYAIHGFRMPLFFLISGFFTAMLFRRRGMRGLLRQRAIRIAIPLGIGMGTIIPLMWWVFAWSAPAVEVSEDATVWSTSQTGDVEALRVLVERGASVDDPDEAMMTSPLGWAALGGQPESAAALLELGANPDQTYGQGSTPMHTAVFLGRSGVARELIEAGADLTIVDGFGSTPVEGLDAPKQITMMIVGFLKIEIDFEQIEAGREEIRAQLAAIGIEAESSGGSGIGPRAVIDGLMQFPFFHHLWFLWHLCWLVGMFAIVVSLFGWVPAGKIPGVLIGTPMSLLWLVPLTLTMQWFMSGSGAYAGFGPDTSTGLVPMPHVLGYYAVFFGFGALVYSRHGAADRLGRGWWITLPLALALLPVSMSLGLQTEWGGELISDDGTRRWASAVSQVLYAWLMTFGLLGLFETLLAKERAWVRYVSDSSYWLYLVHLPLIIMAQSWIAGIEAPWWVKLGGLTVLSSLLLLLSYQFLVRYTPIGWLLNGRRTRRSRSGGAPEAPVGG